MPIWTRWQGKPWPGVPIDWSHPLANGLRAAWAFNEGSGSPADAVSGLVASPVAGPTWIASPSGGAMNFASASSQYLSVPASPNLAFSGDNTLSCWVKTSAAQSVLIGGYQGVSPFAGYGFGVNSSGGAGVGKLNYWNGQNVAWLVDSGPTVNTGAWVHVAAASGLVGGVQTTNFYVNGVLNSAGTGTAAGQCTAYQGTRRLAGDGNVSNYLTGSLDGVAIWSRMLSASEIASLYMAPWQIFRPPFGWLIPGSGTSTGSGAVTLAGFAGAGSGSFAAGGAGAVTLAGFSVAGTGSFAASGSGAPTLGALAAAGTGSFTASASGAVTLTGLSSAGVGTFAAGATGSVTLAGLGVSGSGTASSPGTSTGTGAVALAGLAASGTGSFTASAAGAVTLTGLTSAGTGSFATTATGSVTLAGLTVAGVGTFTSAIVGALTAYPDPFAATTRVSVDPFGARLKGP